MGSFEQDPLLQNYTFMVEAAPRSGSAITVEAAPRSGSAITVEAAPRSGSAIRRGSTTISFDLRTRQTPGASARASTRVRISLLPSYERGLDRPRFPEESGLVPELPDLTVYVEALETHLVARTLEKIRIQSPSLLKSVDPSPTAIEGLPVAGIRLLGKRLVFEFERELFLVLHLMVAGRLHWKKRGVAIPRKRAHAAFDFPEGSLLITEASTKKRASLHVVEGLANLDALDPGGLDVSSASPTEFREVFTRERHTLKRSLTDPHLLSGIGNAYSDEILHRAQLSPVKMSDKLSDAEHQRLFEATRNVLEEWTLRLREEADGGFPKKVTAFRPEMAVHGKFRDPCPICSTPVQRIVRAENEVNYCPGCQTGGRVLADRALSKLLGKDWPRTIEELEKRRPTPTRDG
jgi:formamidopyrimidine-DNA glycosylase